jgi:hypothetical protein
MLCPLEEEIRSATRIDKRVLETGKIRLSKFPTRTPILFVPTADGRGLRLCVDYRGINKITIANRYTLPIMSQLPDRLWGSRLFTKIDLKNRYHLICIVTTHMSRKIII